MTHRKLLYLSATALGILALILLSFANPEKLAFELCFSRRVFHFYCAGCGATRATYALLHGNFTAALHYNPVYTLILLPLFAYFWTALGIQIFFPKQRFRLPIPGFRWAVALLVLLVLYSLLRNLPFEFFQGWRPE